MLSSRVPCIRCFLYIRVCTLVAQSCLTLCDRMDCSPPGSSVLGFSRQKYWSGLPFLSPGDLPDPRIKPRSPALRADSLPSEPPGKPLNNSPKIRKLRDPTRRLRCLLGSFLSLFSESHQRTEGSFLCFETK